MLPIPISFYIYAGLAVLALAGIGYGKYESAKYDAYVAKVEALGKAQEAHVESVVKQQDLVTKGIKNEYESKLSAIRNYYGGMQLNSGSRSMSGISPTPKGADAETAYPILAGQCAETTQQVISLQDWINAQVGIK
jgi:hypothetical protein